MDLRLAPSEGSSAPKDVLRLPVQGCKLREVQNIAMWLCTSLNMYLWDHDSE